MQEKELLVLDLQEPVSKVRICTIGESEIPEYLNSERGVHVYHVRVLTELILRQLAQNGQRYDLSEREIREISIASSLHDVGKARVPRGILEHPGALSPLEYDIVKKHTVFGEELIANARAEGVEQSILSYARQIARCHHERIDGTGYPDGLTGADVPLCAQVVALADAYDALTSTRNYKQAYCQNVAVQMIASGMCGVFQEVLVESLIQVVNHSTLVALRQRVQKERTVIDREETTARCVLCAGNTGYLTKDFLDAAFPESQVVVLGNSELKNSSRIKAFSLKNGMLRDIFDTYDFDTVVYFPASLTHRTEAPMDGRFLEQVLERTAKAKQAVRFLYLSPWTAGQSGESPEKLLAESQERLCSYYARNSDVDVKILRIPHLYSGTCEGDYLHGIFETIAREKTVRLDEMPENQMAFLSMQDLSDLLARLLGNWTSGDGVLTVCDPFCLTYGDLGKALMALAGAKVLFTGSNPVRTEKMDDKVLRSQYGWIAKISILEDLPEQYARFLEQRREEDTSLMHRIRSFLQKHSRMMAVLELLVLFVLTEGLLRATDSAIAFSVVDFRMAYIVLMAVTHGFQYGLAAAGLSSASWLVAKLISGTSWITLFYEPTNWLAFIYYFLIGGVCGYVRIRSDDKIRFATEEKRLLEEKLIFTREIYHQTYCDKRELKKQILGSKDSFGKIFDIARKLDTVEVPMLYLRAVEAFETILENRSIAIYSVNGTQTFGRLEVASRDTMELVTRSISLETYAPVIAAVSGGEIWRNTQLKTEFPMFAAGIHRDGKLAMLIFLWRAEPEQQTLYYTNLFKIIKDLMQMSLLRALQYHETVETRQCIPDTGILNQASFERVLEDAKMLEQRKIARFLLLDIDIREHTLIQADRLLGEKIRQNDTLGLLGSGHVGLLLSQASEAELDVILPRFRDLDMDISVTK